MQAPQPKAESRKPKAAKRTGHPARRTLGAIRPSTFKLPPSPFHRTAGFTLVELMMVVLIISILIAILVPVIGGAIRRARDAEVAGEISQLEDAISAFKAKYGIEPPSQITIAAPGGTWNPRSRALIRRMWPQFDFASSGGINAAVYDQLPRKLHGAQCLVFFLGGIRDGTGALTGFSKNPARPFQPGGNRTGPFFEFKGGFDTAKDDWTSRFVTDNSDNFPEYLDPLPGQANPYLYFSSYDGQGYRTSSELPQHGMTSIYLLQGSSPYKPNGHQIISPGADGLYGTGGLYDPETADSDLAGNRDAERDNITNFSRGRLAP